MFQVGETVLYGVHGVCTIIEISEKTLCGETKPYYTLKPVYALGQSTFFVPVESKDGTSKLCALLTKAGIKKMLAELPNAEQVWVESDSSRKERYTSMLRSGKRSEVMSIIHTLLSRREQLGEINKRLHASDHRFLEEAERLMLDEISFVYDIERKSAKEYVEENLVDFAL